MKKTGEAKPRSWLDDIDLVARPAAVFVVALACSVVAIGAASWFSAGKDIELAQATQIRDDAASRFLNVENEKKDIRVYQPRFLELQTAGLVGDENRLAWIEAVKQIQAERKLLSVAYNIEPQQALAMERPMQLGDYQLRGSRMKLQMGLLHEIDLFHFLDDLRSAGMFTVQECKLRRTDAPPESLDAPRVLSDCTLVWLSLGMKPPAPAPAPSPRVARRWR